MNKYFKNFALFAKHNAFIVIFNLYILISYLIYSFGPLDFPNKSILTFVWVFGFQLMFSTGFLFGKKIIVNKTSKEIQINVKYLLISFLGLSIFLSFMIMVRVSNSFNVLVILDNIKRGFISPGEMYKQNMIANMGSLIGGSIISVLMTISSPFILLSQTIALFYFKKLDRKTKVLLIISIMFEILSFIIRGTNSGIFRMAIILVTVMAYSKELNFKKLYFPILIAISLAILYFIFNITTRIGYEVIPQTYMGIEVNQNHFIFTIFGNLGISLMMATSYISQGFNGLRIALSMPLVSTLGFGSGRFLISKGSVLLQTNLWERTFQYRMSNTWDASVSWHTVYTWFANDFGFVWVLFIMLVIGFIFAVVSKEAKSKNVIAISIIPLYIVMFLFFPANNFVFDNPLLFLPFAILHVLLLIDYKFIRLRFL